jgi:serine/threonine protein kinase
MTNLIGQSLGHYHILEQLGEGGMAIVYKARDLHLERDVAVKVIRTDIFGPVILERMLKRFQKEGRALGKLTYPNIVPILNYGEHDGTPYLVMPYLPGGTLKDRMKKRMPYHEAIRLLTPIAQALAHGHELGIIHRDVKPSNILITSTGEPMLSDFGIAKILDAEETRELTATGTGIGTPEYMAPEQGMGQVDERSDIYALGIILYEMVVGRIPFQADTPMAILLKKNQDALPSPRQFVPDLPQSVENVLIKALARDPNHRYQSMRNLVSALERLGRDESVTVDKLDTRETASYEESRTVEMPYGRKSYTTWILAGVGGFIALVVCGIGAFAVSRLIPSDNHKTDSNSFESPVTFITPSDSNTHVAEIPTSILRATQLPFRYTDTPMTTPDEMVDNFGVAMRYVPAGTFSMGSNNGEADERPVHVVDLPAFYIDKYEVTNKLYKICVNDGACVLPQIKSTTRSNYYSDSIYNDYPVIVVNWDAASIYCRWRGARLPSEEEWEKAARGTGGRTYPWGESIDCSYANYGEPNRCQGDTTRVGSYEDGKSPYGLYDMAGNVWEWVNDWYDVYPGGDPSLYPSDYGQIYRVVRGGSWGTKGFYVRSSFRGWPDPDFPYGSIGFRCARDANP